MNAWAVICHATAAGATYTGSAYATINTWQLAPLDTTFTHQINADGTAASFATVASNVVTLVSGTYRIRGWSMMNCGTNGKLFATRLYNVTAAAALWVGKPNEVSESILNPGANTPIQLNFAGDITLAATTGIRIEGYCNFATGVTFGSPQNTAGTFVLPNELYRWMEIVKTA